MEVNREMKYVTRINSDTRGLMLQVSYNHYITKNNQKQYQHIVV